MAEVGFAAGADDFGTTEPITAVRAEFDMVGQSFVKTRPATAAVKFVFGGKQRISAAGTNVDAVFVEFGVFSGKGGFGYFLTQNTVLFRR